jgi:carbon-monoxide dehydrogenase large subunit
VTDPPITRGDGTAPPHASERLTGQALLRKEDPRLVVGQGRYVDDLKLPGMLHMAIARATQVGHVHVDVSPTIDLPGVVAAFTGADLADAFVAPLPLAWSVTPDIKAPAHWPLTLDVARYVGDGVAVILATDRRAAAGGAEAVLLDYEPTSPVMDVTAALDLGTPLVHEELGTNQCYEMTLRGGDPNKAFAEAAVIVRERYINQRVAPMPVEPRGVVVDVVPSTGNITIWSSTQIPHILRVQLALMLGLPEQRVRVIAPDVGGGFGAKINVYAEEALAVALATKLGRPVKWIETRTEHLRATPHGRDQIQEIELAATDEGRITGIRCTITSDLGAYLQLLTPGMAVLTGFMVPGAYDVQNFDAKVIGVFTNKTPTDSCRGAGRPEATYVIERTVDALARAVGRDPAEVRRLNFVRPDQFPYSSATSLVYDSGNYAATLEKALEIVDYPTLRAEQALRRTRGDALMLGVGLSSYVEICGVGPSAGLGHLGFGAGGWESGLVRVEPTGKVSVFSGCCGHGQGHATPWSQLVADELGVAFDDVEVVEGDTALTPFGMGTYGSRSLAVGGAALIGACRKVVAKARLIAAHLLQVTPDELGFEAGRFLVQGEETKGVSIQEVAFAAFTAHDLPPDVEPMLEGLCVWDPPNFTFPFGTHVCVVEVDTETGKVQVINYVAVDDCGNVVNPLIVEGQIQGGIAQGVAQALFEEVVYGADAQLLTHSLSDYGIPTAVDLPSFLTTRTTTPTDANPMGAKGVGQTGTIASIAPVVNAVIDALVPLGVTRIDMPCTPLRVWEAISAARASEKMQS